MSSVIHGFGFPRTLKVLIGACWSSYWFCNHAVHIQDTPFISFVVRKLVCWPWLQHLQQAVFASGRTGVFSCCVISWFYFPWNVNLGSYSSWLVTWSFIMIRKEPELLSDIRDFTTLFYIISDASKNVCILNGQRFAVWSVDLACF